MRFKDSNFVVIVSASVLIFIFSLLNFNKVSVQSPENELGFPGCGNEELSGNIDYSRTDGYFEGESITLPKVAYNLDYPNVLGVSQEERWIEIDLSEQKLYAWEGDTLFLETPVSSGLPYFPTPTGEFRIWTKLRATRMEGGNGAYYYDLPNVPYVMFFENDSTPAFRGYGLHGTYWHNDFGKPHSHGCVNLPTDVAKELYYWTSPTVPEGKWMENSSATDPGTRIVIHE